MYKYLAVVCTMFVTSNMLAQTDTGRAARINRVLTEESKKAPSSTAIKRIIQDRSFFSLNLCVVPFASSKNAPYHNAFFTGIESSTPNGTNKRFFTVTLQGGIFTNPNKQWFSNALLTKESNISSIKPSFSISSELSYGWVISNTKKYAFSLGPVLGYKNILFSKVGMYVSNKIKMDVQHDLHTGIRANVFTKHFIFLIEYHKAFVDTYSNTEADPTIEIPINTNILLFGVGKFFK